jgi:hypothetical protein
MRTARFAWTLVLLLVSVRLTAVERWRFFFEEVEVARLLRDLSTRHRPDDVALVGVNVIPMTGAGVVLRNQTVLIARDASRRSAARWRSRKRRAASTRAAST